MTLPTPRILFAAFVVVSSLTALRAAPVRLTANDASAGAALGSAVAVDHDTLVVGAPNDNAAGPFAGSVYVYTHSGKNWQQQSKITGPATSGYRSFGSSVAVSRNVIVVGAPFENTSGMASGAAYVYVRTGNKWALHTKLLPSDSAKNQQFGNAVAIDDNVIVVGAFLDSAGPTNAGAAYVFIRSGNAWSQRAKLAASDASAFAFFGSAVAVNGLQIVVGAPTSETAYIFAPTKTGWGEQALLTASDALEGDYSAFGAAVAIEDDTVVIGAPLEGMNAVRAGAAYLYKRKGQTWTAQKKITAPDSDTEDEFGTAVALDGHVLAIGAPYEGDFNEGSIYLFDTKAHDAGFKTKFVATAPGSTFLGFSVAVSDSALAGGAPAFPEFKPSPAGAAYVFTTR